MHELVEGLFLEYFRNPTLEQLEDQAVIEIPNGRGPARLAFTTDSYVVTPLFFPGGDIGRLAVNGTINDLAMSGAEPLYLSAGFIIEEGFPIADLKRGLSRCVRQQPTPACKSSLATRKWLRKERRTNFLLTPPVSVCCIRS